MSPPMQALKTPAAPTLLPGQVLRPHPHVIVEGLGVALFILQFYPESASKTSTVLRGNTYTLCHRRKGATSLVVWVRVDSRGPASLHLASDSRISWGEPKTGSHLIFGTFERKVFASTRHPDIFGYCGDVAFPSKRCSHKNAVLQSRSLESKIACGQFPTANARSGAFAAGNCGSPAAGRSCGTTARGRRRSSIRCRRSSTA